MPWLSDFVRLNNYWTHLLQTKKAYETACKELEQIDVKVNTAKNASLTTMGSKEWEKVKYFAKILLLLRLDQTTPQYRVPAYEK